MVNVWTSRLVHSGGAALLLALLSWMGVEAQPQGRGDVQTVRGKVTRLTTAPKGEIDGAELEDGTVIHWPPHLEERFTQIVKKDDRIEATGRMETGKRGDTHFEILKITNLRTKVSAENDEPPPPKDKEKGKGKGKEKGKDKGPPPDGGPGAPPERSISGKMPPRTLEDRVQALEDKIDQLTRAIERLQNKK